MPGICERKLGGTVGNRISELAIGQSEKLDMVIGQITALTEGNERRQEALRVNVEAKLGELKSDSGEQQAALRRTVEERLDAIRNENMEKDFSGYFGALFGRLRAG